MWDTYWFHVLCYTVNIQNYFSCSFYILKFSQFFVQGFLDNMDSLKEKADNAHLQIVKVIEEKHQLQMKKLEEQRKNQVRFLYKNSKCFWDRN